MSNVVEAVDPSPRHNILKQPALVRSFELLATADDGVAKLREMILMLAVRGKIEPQSHSEQPAKKLVSQIGAAKRQLLDSGRIRRDKPTPEVRDDDVPWAIPSNWVWVRLGDLGQIVGGGTPKSDDHAMWSPPTVPWLTPADLYRSTEKYVARGRRKISEVGLASSSAQLLPPSTVLFSSRAPIGYVAIAAEPLATNQGFKSCVPHLPSLAGYLYWFLKSAAKGIDAAASGTTFKEISGGEFSKVLVPLPPLAEQHRIVARVEELMKLCDVLEQSGRLADEQHARLASTLFDALATSESAHALAENWLRIAEHFDILLDRAEAIDAFDQTVLQLAVRGVLVSQAASDEPAFALLDRIAAYRQGSLGRGKYTLPTAIDEAACPFTVPAGWAWAPWEAVALQIGDIDHKMPREVADGVPYISPRDFIEGNGIDFANAKKITVTDYEDLASKIRPERGDLIYPRYGTIGKVRLVETDERFLASYSCAIIKCLPKFVDPNYQYLVSISPLIVDQAAAATNKTTQPNVGLKSIKTFLFPLPPLAEQRRVVARVEELRRLSADLRNRLLQARQTQSRLAAALVTEAA